MLHQFELTPKMERRANGTLLTPRMSIVISVNSFDPFYNGAKEVIAEYDRVWNYDYRRAGATKAWFYIERLD